MKFIDNRLINNHTEKYLIFLAILLISIIHFLMVAWLAINMDIYYDGAYHVPIIEEIVETRELPVYHPLLLSPYGGSNFGKVLIQYPPLYYIFGAVLFPIFGAKVIAVMEIIASTAIIPLVYLVFKSLYNKKIGLLASLILGLSPGLKFEGWDQDIIVAAFGFLILLVYLRVLKNPKFLNLILLAFLMAISVGIKQSAFLYISAIFLHFIFYNLFNKKIKASFRLKMKNFVLLLISFLIISFPIIYHQVSATGTLPGIPSGVNKVITKIFHHEDSDTEVWQSELNEKVRIEYLRQEALKFYNRVNPNVSDFLFKQPWPLFNKFFNVYKTSSIVTQDDLNSIWYLSPFICFIGVLLLIGIVLFLFNLNLKRSIILFVVILSIPAIFYTSKIQYSLILIYVSVLFIALTLDLLIRCLLNKKIVPVLLLFIIIFSLIDSTNFIAKAYNEAYDKVESKEGLNIKGISEWLRKNSNQDDLIMGSLLQFFPHYSDRKTFWDYRLFFIDNEDDVMFYLKNYYKPKYIVIYNFQIVDDWSYWVHISRDSKFLELLEEDRNNFTKVYSKEGIVNIYEFNRN